MTLTRLTLRPFELPAHAVLHHWRHAKCVLLSSMMDLIRGEGISPFNLITTSDEGNPIVYLCLKFHQQGSASPAVNRNVNYP